MRFYYTLKTIDPIIVSENNSTENNDACLDYIPGSAILGALAAKHYSKLSTDKSWQTFHSGETLFSHCYPLVENQLALPTPASWHFAKGKEAIDGSGKYDPKQISNHASLLFKREDAVQYKQCRDGYINSNAQSARVEQGLSTKTAINNQTGGAKESQLFSYAYIQPTQTFLGWIDCADDMAERFKETLQQGLHIGRSRHAEFGRVEINIIKDPVTNPATNNDKTLVIWCLSDCECFDEQGMPTFTPSANSLHPKLTGILNKQKSFIRSTSCSRFNQKRAGLDGEQMLISKGSILVYDLDDKAPQALLDAINKNGIGINKQQGLGWISVNPAWASNATLSSDKPLFSGIKIEKESKINNNYTTDTPLLRWMNEKLKEANDTDNRKSQVADLIQYIILAYKNVRRYNNILNSNEAGPSSSQWRRMTNIIREKESHWSKEVFEGEHAICKAKNDQLGWGVSWSDNGQLTDFATFTQSLLSAANVSVMRALLEKINRYDLSTFSGLNKMCKELGIETVQKNNGDNHE